MTSIGNQARAMSSATNHMVQLKSKVEIMPKERKHEMIKETTGMRWRASMVLGRD